MKCFLIGIQIGLWIVCALPAKATVVKDSLLKVLDAEIGQREVHQATKLRRIDSLKKQLNGSSKDLQAHLYIYNLLYDEYKSFVYDSAFRYSRAILATAYQLQDREQIDQGKLKLSFTLLSAGLFRETLDTLQSIVPEQLSKSLRLNYYEQLARTYYDMSDYAQDQYYSGLYNEKGNIYLKQGLALLTPNSASYHGFQGWYYLRNAQPDSSITSYLHQIASLSPNTHTFAIAASSLSSVYRQKGNTEQAIEWAIKAAIADLQSSTRETEAIRNVSELIYRQGDTERAFQYVKLALKDAYFYGARHRKIQISNILPIIDETQLQIVENQRKRLLIYAIAVTSLIVLLIVLAVIIIRQFVRLRHVKNQLSESNLYLHEVNNRLQEVNRIKEVYIGHFFNTISGYIEKIDQFKKSINRKVSAKRYEEISDVIQMMSLREEREQLYHSFDTIFLKIFPNFIEQFNSLLRPDEQIFLKENQPLTPELRIFALIRLGIHESEKIAKILDYSVNTIYTYKTKIKNKSDIPKEKFEEKLMEIRIS